MSDKIALEIAEAEFDNYVDGKRICVDTSIMNEEDLSTFLTNKNRIISAIRYGDLVFNDDGKAVYTPTHPESRDKEPLTFGERTGVTSMAADGKKKGENMKGAYATIAAQCGVHTSIITNLAGYDLKVMESLYILLTV